MRTTFVTVTVTWESRVDLDAEELVLTCVSSYTQARHEYRLPLHVVRSLAEWLPEVLNEHGAVLPGSDPERVG